MDEFDLTIGNGTLVTAVDTIAADVGIRNGGIAARSKIYRVANRYSEITLSPQLTRAREGRAPMMVPAPARAMGSDSRRPDRDDPRIGAAFLIVGSRTTTIEARARL